MNIEIDILGTEDALNTWTLGRATVDGKTYKIQLVRFANIESYRRCAKGGMSADYLYLYDDGEWLVYGLYHEPNWVKMEIKK